MRLHQTNLTICKTYPVLSASVVLYHHIVLLLFHILKLKHNSVGSVSTDILPLRFSLSDFKKHNETNDSRTDTIYKIEVTILLRLRTYNGTCGVNLTLTNMAVLDAA